MKKLLLGFILFNIFNILNGQGSISGNFRLNADFYDRDSAIGTVGKNYDAYKTSANSWFQLFYTNPEMQFDAGIRFDVHLNSILQNPIVPRTFNGIGYWYLRKKIDKLEVTGGYFYEQYGSGIALRAFEERNLGIDNAIFGAKATYDLTDNIKLKGLAGVQKYELGTNQQFIKAINVEVNKEINENLSFNAGASVVNRTLDATSRGAVDAIIRQYTNPDDKFNTSYNTVIYQLYNTLTYKNLTWYFEGAYKSPEAVYNGFNRKYEERAGTSFLTSLTYTKPKFGVTAQARRTDHFQFMANSHEASQGDFNKINNTRIGYIAPINRQNSLRLPARFQIAPQDIGELGTSLDFTYSPFPKVAINLSLCMIDTINITDPYYREAYGDIEFKKLLGGKLKALFGGQYVYYNQILYQQDGKKDVVAYTFFSEASYKISKQKSIRAELQYQHAEKELGQSIFALVEFNIAPTWSFSISDLYNFKTNPNYFIVENRVPHHFYSFFAAYTKGATRLTMGYVKQLQGIVCTGGVCRMEPAFSGIRAQLTTSF
jgi:hypothetical protein